MVAISFTGLGFLAPALMVLPYLLTYWLLQLTVPAGGRLWPYLLAATAALVLTYAIGRRLNANGIRHRLCNIRFENWAFIQFAMTAAVYGLFWLGAVYPP
ncbi:MAG: hypothetical protein R3E77_13850 [Steroidobacteraceae bacterium]